MLRSCLFVLGLVIATSSSGGCRSCSKCHDYGPPVANCNCQACGQHRAGSASEYMESPFMDDGYYEPQEGRQHGPNEVLPPPQSVDPPQSINGPSMGYMGRR
jgi:hypothetical protein